MGVALKSIILEDTLEEMISYMPAMSFDVGGDTFPINFGYGDRLDLNAFLQTREESDTYPLIWLLYPYEEKHTNTKLEVSGATFILAVDTNNSMQNLERIKETFGKVLMPLLFNFRLLFKKANIINTNLEFDVVKHPNFSDSELRDKTATTVVWDALKVTTDFTVTDTCLKEITF